MWQHDWESACLKEFFHGQTFQPALILAPFDSVPDLRRLAKSCSRAAIVGEIGKTTGEAALLGEALALHARSVKLNRQLLEQDPGNAPLRRSYAGGLIMKASVHILAVQDLETALADCTRALVMQKALAAADPANAEAQQDLT